MRAVIIAGLLFCPAIQMSAATPPALTVDRISSHVLEHAGNNVRVSGYVGCVRGSRWCLLFARAEGLSESLSFDAAALRTADYERALRCGLGSSEPRCPATLTGRMRGIGEQTDTTLAVKSVVWDRP